MDITPVVFVAFEEFDNLGVGYMASVLSESGYESCVIDFRDGKKKILKSLTEIDPIIVGFSVIFEYHIYEFAELIKYLREGGVKSHFTAGGQFASLNFKELFNIIPSFDSVVRFEGEFTFLELVNCIYKGTDWNNISGIAYKINDKIIVNPLRKVITDLDELPYPLRSPLKNYAFNKRFSTILAGRGCSNNCIFCYLRGYYQQSSGPIKRIRRPEEVVQEMLQLHIEMDCSVFLFQDDDFPVKPEKNQEWVKKFCKKLTQSNLAHKIMWKINCRPDEVDLSSFSMMKNHGLFLVFLGIEDGTDEGLIRLNKHMTVEKCLEGLSILKKLEIDFDYGFMLFQPSSTFRSVNDNLDFLRKICGDGSTPVTFLKMMPYSGTSIEKELRNEERLKGIPGFLDYDFQDKSLNEYYNFITDCLMEWLRDTNGLLNISKWARNYISVFSFYFGKNDEIKGLSENFINIISESNLYLLDTLKELSALFESGRYTTENHDALNNFRTEISRKEEYFKKLVNNTIIELKAYFESQRILQRH